MDSDRSGIRRFRQALYSNACVIPGWGAYEIDGRVIGCSPYTFLKVRHIPQIAGVSLAHINVDGTPGRYHHKEQDSHYQIKKRIILQHKQLNI